MRAPIDANLEKDRRLFFGIACICVATTIGELVSKRKPFLLDQHLERTIDGNRRLVAMLLTRNPCIDR